MKARFLVEVEWDDSLNYLSAISTLKAAAYCITNVYSASVKELPHDAIDSRQVAFQKDQGAPS